MYRLALALLLALNALPLMAAQVEEAYLPRTGDAWVDRALQDMEAYAARYPHSFVDEMTRYLGLSRDYAEGLLQQPGWRPGDAYFACALARALELSCREVVRERARDYRADWQQAAEALGASSRSGRYPTVRSIIRRSYAHWARPLPE